MSRQVIEFVWCDLCEKDTEAEPDPQEFGAYGQTYQLDLCERHKTEVDGILAEWMASAMLVEAPASSRKKIRRRNRWAGRDIDSRLARAWALEQGFVLSNRGRLPNPVIQRWLDEGRPRPQAMAS